MTIRVRCEVRQHRTKEIDPEPIIVESDSIWDDSVWITIGTNKVCVIARQMIAAIENARRIER